MPLVRLETSQVSLFYRTSYDELDPKKPTLVLLHGVFMSSEFLSPQLDYTPLSDKANVIAFDQLSCGQTENPVSSRRDASVEAAAVLLALDQLGITTPVHLFAVQVYSINVALVLALLWPSRVASLCLCGVSGSLDKFGWSLDALRAWGFAADISGLEEAMVPMLHYIFGDSQRLITKHERDALIAYWETRYPPFKRTSLLDVGLALLQPSFAVDHLASITQPVLILHGGGAAIHAEAAASQFQSGFQNARGGARLHIVPAGPENVQYPRFFANLVNPYYVSFLATLQEQPLSEQIASLSLFAGPSDNTHLQAGLQRLAGLTGRQHARTASDRPITIWDFSTVKAEKATENNSLMTTFALGEGTAYSPLNADGTPIRKFSERDFDILFEPVETALQRRPSIDMMKHIEIISEADDIDL